MTDDPAARELERIQSEYRRRDAEGPGPGLGDAAHRAHVEDLERELVRAIGDVGASLAGASVLDVGAGDGHLLQRMVDLGAAKGTGIELMQDRVDAAAVRHPRLDVRVGDASKLPFADAAFDVVTQFTCLSSVLDPSMRERIAAEMIRVTRPGGTIVSYDLRPAPLPIRAAGKLVRRVRERRSGAPLWTPVQPLAAGELRRLFRADDALVRSVSLNVALPASLRVRPGAASALGTLPPLRSHLLLVARKPG